MNEREKRYVRDLEFFSKMAVGLVNLPIEADLHLFIAEQLKELVGNGMVVVNSFDEATQKFCVRAILGIGRHMDNVLKILGRHPVGMTTPINGDAREGLTSGRLERVPGGLYDLAVGSIPKAACDGIEKILGLKDAYAMGFSWSGKLFGSAIVFMFRGSQMRDPSIIETFIRQASIAFQRRQAEEALRKANEELEIRIKRRTEELAKSNAELQREIAERKRAEEELKSSEERLKVIFEFAPDGYYLNDLKGNFVDGNKAAEEIVGYKREELIGKNFLKLTLLPPKQIPKAAAVLAKNALGMSSGPDEFTLNRKDGNQVLVEINTFPVKFKRKTLVLGIARDITERRRTEKALNEEKDKAQKYLNIAGVMIVAINTKEEITLINRKGCEILGYKKEELIGENWFDTCLPPDVRENERLVFKKLLAEERTPVEYYENPVLTKLAKEKVIAWNLIVLKDEKGNMTGTLSSGKDITDRKKAEEKLKASLEEKGVMLREIHHRVKNNMQIVSSLLRLQSQNIKNRKLLGMFSEAYNRIKSMALIHEGLYGSKDLAKINFADYVKKITTHLFSVYHRISKSIKLKLKVREIYFDINTAIPCGLIINELVTNSLKHAFFEGESGEISVKIEKSQDKFTMFVKDTGKGFPKDLDFLRAKTLGIQLVTDLVDQLDGRIRLYRKNGTKFKITF